MFKIKFNSLIYNRIYNIIRSIRTTKSYRITNLVILSIVLSISLFSQPSGGPYGPVHKSYEIPVTAGKIFYVGPEGNPQAQGENLSTPTTIEYAIEHASSGDVIILRGGIYRTGNLVLNQGITIQPYKNEQPVFKGTLVASEWKDLHNGLWVTNWTHLFPSAPANWWVRNRNGKVTPQHRFNDDMVFVDGEFLQSAGWEGEVDEQSFFINYETGEVFIGIDPTNRLIEITAFNVAINRITGECNGKTSDKKGYTLKGITFTQYAYRALEIEGKNPEGISPESEHGKDVTGTIIENCEISYCSRVAAYLRGDNLKLLNCKVSNTSTEGIYVLSSSDVLLEKNIFARNNIEGITGYFPAAVKIFNQCYRVTCNDNLVIDHPYSNGIWYDVGNVDGIFTNNWIENIGLTDRPFTNKRTWPSESGFFFEISKGAVCAGNVFVNCEHGIHILNSSKVEVYNNTFINSTAVFGRNGRSAEGDHFGWHPASGPGVEERTGHVFANNLLTADKNFNRPLLFVWQPADLCARVSDSPLKELENNRFIKENTKATMPVIYWSPANNAECQQVINTPEELINLYPQFSNVGSYSFESLNSVFKSPELGNYQPLNTAIAGKGIELPDKITKLLGWTKIKQLKVGAYQTE